MRDPYKELGVAKDASAKDIKSAFRKLAKKYHPDQNPNDPRSKERFNAANQAYEIVGDEAKRKAFDSGEIDAEGKPKFQGFAGNPGEDPFAGFRRQAGPGGASHFEFRSGGPAGGAGDGGDIFSELFGQFSGGRAGPRHAASGGDINASLDVTIEEIAGGGKVNAVFPDGRRLAVKLPDFVEEGQTVRLKGQGEQGPGGAGDAMVKIHILPHPRYRLEGRDLHVDLAVPLADAVLGAKVPLDIPTGRLAVSVPAWSSSDKVLRLKGRGLPQKSGSPADLYVHVRIMLPEGGDAELETLLRKRQQ